MSAGGGSGVGSSFTISRFVIKQQIGSGRFGIVYRAVQRYSEQEVAIKIIPKKNISSGSLHKQLQREVEIHSKLKHPSICELYAYFHDANSVYIVLEFCPHGSLERPIRGREAMSEKKIASIFLQVAQALAYMHERRVMHRDLKLENILLDQFNNAKVSDFGWCVHQAAPRLTFCGTMEYICPEMLNKQKYEHSVDVYCLGVILYELFYFRSPFLGESEEETFRRIREGEVAFDDGVRVVPPVAKDLIRQLLSRNPQDRPRAADLINHEFVQQFLREEKPKKERITEKEFKRWRDSLTVEETAELEEKEEKEEREVEEAGNEEKAEQFMAIPEAVQSQKEE